MSELIPIQDWLKDLRDSILPRQFEQIDEPDDPLEPVFTDEDGTPAQKDQGEFNQKGDLTSEDPDSTEDGGNDAGDSGGGGGDDGGGGGGGGDDGGFDFSESDDGDYKQDEKKPAGPKAPAAGKKPEPIGTKDDLYAAKVAYDPTGVRATIMSAIEAGRKKLDNAQKDFSAGQPDQPAKSSQEPKNHTTDVMPNPAPESTINSQQASKVENPGAVKVGLPNGGSFEGSATDAKKAADAFDEEADDIFAESYRQRKKADDPPPPGDTESCDEELCDSCDTELCESCDEELCESCETDDVCHSCETAPCETAPCETAPCDNESCDEELCDYCETDDVCHSCETVPCETAPCETAPCETAPCETAPCDAEVCETCDVQDECGPGDEEACDAELCDSCDTELCESCDWEFCESCDSELCASCDEELCDSCDEEFCQSCESDDVCHSCS